MSFISRLLETRTIEDPRVPLSAFAGDFGFRTRAGVPINRTSTLGLPAAWRAVNLISKDVAKIPLSIFRRDSINGKTPDQSHPGFSLLKYQPNEWTTSFIFRETLQAHALLTGNGYALIERDQGGRPVSLIQVDPQNVIPLRLKSFDTQGRLILGEMFYVIHIERTGEKIRLEPTDVLHIKGLGFNGLVGLSIVEYAKESLGISVGARDFGSVYFQNASTPKVVLEHPRVLKQQAAERLRDSWERMHSGLDNAHRTAILEEGMQAKTLSFNNKDSQLVELRQFEIREVANIFGVPPHKIGDPTKSSFASIEQENQRYLDESLDPWLVNWEMELRTKILTEREKDVDSHVVEFNRRALVRADAENRAKMYASGIQNGWLSRDEARNAENLPPIPGGEGKVFLVPINLAPAGEEIPRSESPGEVRSVDGIPTRVPIVLPEEEGCSDDSRSVDGIPPRVSIVEDIMACANDVLDNALRRCITRLVNAGEKARSKPDRFLEWIDQLPLKHRHVLEEVLDSPLRLMRAVRGGAPPLGEVVDYFLNHARDDLLLFSGECTKKDLAERMQSDWMINFPTRFLSKMKEFINE